ncbi:MAG: hypothetical protein ABSF45_12345 [Terriglobia bacterium]|jgi:hypothetical protein
MPDSAVESHGSDLESWRIPAAAHGAAVILILGVTCASLHFFYTQGLSNLYGDGLAHMEGARRIFDSITPGYEEIGSVWLPLYHLICAPLAANDFLWRTGLAGGLVSSAAFAVICYLLFRLGAEINCNLAAGLAALAGAMLCPSFLYLASTPLTEPLALLWSVLVAYALFRYSQSGSWRSLAGASAAALMGTLTRYEGWNVLPFATLLVFLIYPYPWRRRFIRASFFAAVSGAGPLWWLIHNAYRYKNPLEFYNGLNSAKDIYAHQLATTAFPYPTDGSLLLSTRYYLEDLKLVIGVWALELAILGLVAWCASLRESRRGAVAVLLIVPLPFYIEAMAYAAIPLYVPTLFPHTYYNLRYGMEMIAAVALFPSFVLSPRLGKKLRWALLIIFLALLGRQFAALTAGGARELPVVKESILNTPCRAKRQRAIIEFLREHYDGKRVLVASGKWPCVMPEAGIYFRNTLSNLNRKYWAKMQTEPEKWVEWIIRGEGDAVDSLMQAYPQAFGDFEVIDQGAFQGEGSFKIYRLRRRR